MNKPTASTCSNLASNRSIVFSHHSSKPLRQTSPSQPKISPTCLRNNDGYRHRLPRRSGIHLVYFSISKMQYASSVERRSMGLQRKAEVLAKKRLYHSKDGETLGLCPRKRLSIEKTRFGVLFFRKGVH